MGQWILTSSVTNFLLSVSFSFPMCNMRISIFLTGWL